MKKYKLIDIIFPVLAFIVVAVLLFTVCIPNVIGIIDDSHTSTIYDKNIATYSQNIDQLKSFPIATLNQKLISLNDQIPVGGDLGNFVNNTIKLANSFGLSAQQNVISKSSKTNLNAINIQDLQSTDYLVVPDNILINGLVYPINISINIQGDKAKMISFMSSIHTQTRLLDIISVDMNKDKDSTWTAKLSIYGYAVQEPKPDLRKQSSIVDPLDPSLSKDVKPVNLNID